MRTTKSIRNITVTLLFQGLSLLVSFFARQYFISRLGTSILGLNGIYENVLSMLSLAELGFSTAFMFALFKPVADNDIPRIQSLMHYFKKIYLLIGAVIFVAGLAVIPFLHLFIKTEISLSQVIAYYVLYLAGVSVTYLFSYKKTLLIAYQDKYITSIIAYSVFCALNLVQILLLYISGSYTLFLVAFIAANLTEGLIVNTVSNKRHAFLRASSGAVSAEDKAFIAKNVQALFIHRFGGVVINGTDNIVISTFVGLTQVGLYSNYLLILNAISVIVNQIFTGIAASVGNLGTTEDKTRFYEVYRIGLYLNALLFGSITVVLWFVINDFIMVWIGPSFSLDRPVVTLILVNFFINGMRRITATYRDAQGLYWYDRYKPIIESVINLTVSIVLARRIGMAGVFIGTLVSLVTTSFWVEPYVLFKYGFGRKLGAYFMPFFFYCAVSIASFAVVALVNCAIPAATTYLAVALKALGYTVATVSVFVLLTIKTKEFAAVRDIALGLLKHRSGKLFR